MSEVCGDNRFELIGEFKGKLVEGTNIETSPEEMAVLDNILFRFWQMGWLDKLKAQEPVEPTKPDEDNMVYCGACGAPVGYEVLEPPGMDYIRYNYCPNCGREVKWG